MEEKQEVTQPRMVRVAEFCRRYGVRRETVWRWRRAGLVKSVVIGSTVFILDDIAARTTEQAVAAKGGV